MRFLYFLPILCVLLVANETKFWDYNSCKECHSEQVALWSSSWHSNSHIEKNELYAQSIKIVAKQANKKEEDIILQCGTCHNPHLDVKQIDDNYKYAKMFNFETNKTILIDKALHAEHILGGISCYVCHRIDSIKENRDPKVDFGYKAISWASGDVIVGPFSETGRTNFHKSVQKQHFIKGDEICLVCHQGQGGINELSMYNTGAESEKIQNKKRCVECHMGSSYETINAPKTNANLASIRLNRPHLFMAGRNLSLLKTSFDIKFDKQTRVLSLKNNISHNIPTGFGSRMILIKINFYTDDSLVTTENHYIRTLYENEYGTTLPYIATKIKENKIFKPFEERNIQIYPPKICNKISVTLEYYFIDPSVARDLNLKLSDTFTKPQIMFHKFFDLK